MEPDFSGWATRANLRCSDGRVIKPEAFQHMDGQQVPLVWMHSHNNPGNVLGYAKLTAKPEGVWADAYFNSTPNGKNGQALVQHGDVTMMSIFANELLEKGNEVWHGFIREVSLVLTGANPGAKIEQVRIAHSDGFEEDLDGAAVIYTGETFLMHSADESVEDEDENEEEEETEEEDADEELAHTLSADATLQDVYDSLDEEQLALVHYMLGAALEQNGGSAEHSSTTTSEDNGSDDTLAHKEGDNMSRNVFDQSGAVLGEAKKGPTLSHSQIQQVVQTGQKLGSLKEGLLAHAAEYGIEDIDLLFPDAKSVTNTPELIARRTEWVAGIVDGAKHSPFSRIKSFAADLTAEEARAKGYVKGNLKKEEIIKLLKRVTTPTTVYKKQKLDRDDIVDITDFDVVVWLKWEMRFMLQEEIARAILIGDGREPDDDDKIDEDMLRPIAWDDDMYAHKVTVAANVSPEETIEAVIRARKNYKGTGTPTFYTTDDIITDMLLIKDKMGRFVYGTEQELAAKLRVKALVAVEVMEDEADLLGIMVNIADYTIGADKGGELNFFDDFDIDYNQFKYLYETRISGALTKPKSAVIVKRTSGTTVTPTTPAYNATTHVLTVPTVTGVHYFNVTNPLSEVALTNGATVTLTVTSDIEARPDSGYNFPHGTDADWVFAVV